MITTNLTFFSFFDQILDYIKKPSVVHFLTNIAVGLLILLIGLWVIKRITTGVRLYFDRRKVDPSIKSFLIPIISIVLKIVLLIMVFKRIGLETTSFLALLGSVGLAVGLALQGSLSNFAGGVLILMLKPYKVGDFIEAKGFSGTVKDIHLFYTILTTANGQKVVIPNGELSNSSVINYSSNPTRRLDFTFSVGYDDDINQVKSLLMDLISKNEYVLHDPVPEVVLAEYGAHAINFKVRGWVNRENYWNVYWKIMYEVKDLFDQNDISIPYPQMDVHLPVK